MGVNIPHIYSLFPLFLRSKLVRLFRPQQPLETALATAFAEKYNVLYDIMFDTSGSFIGDLGIATAPMTLFVDVQGIIVDQVAGEITADKLESLIAKWFAQ